MRTKSKSIYKYNRFGKPVLSHDSDGWIVEYSDGTHGVVFTKRKINVLISQGLKIRAFDFTSEIIKERLP